MDKKPMKSLSSYSHKTDVQFNKSWTKNPNRRENNTLNKNDPRNKAASGQAKNRPNVDKRPRPRGVFNPNGGDFPTFEDVSSAGAGLVSDTASDEADYTQEFDEFNSFYTPVPYGNKKQNLNHLLNFHYCSRDDNSPRGLNVFGRTGGNRNGGHARKQNKYNKEQFLLANFQFVIKTNVGPKLLNSSPDTLIDWGLIEQINIQTSEEPQCPICLYPPIAAKLTRCGHAYCWPCILHYLSLSDKNWRKCPICYEAIHLGDLKSTSIVQHINFNVGNFITLQLMKRKKGSMFIEKADVLPSDEIIPHMLAESNQTKFSKFLIADLTEVLSIIERERQELVHGEDPDCPEFVFIQQALDLLNERRANLLKEMSIDEKKLEKLRMAVKEAENEINPNPLPIQEFQANSDKEDETTINNEDVAQAIALDPIIVKDTVKYQYFYQSADGQNVFLHPLNVKMLQVMYGSLDQGPSIVNGKIIQKESLSMDEMLRKKFTCLGHLPLTCQFEIVEIELTPPIVSDVVMKMFRDDILLRQKTRMQRDREERKREKKINEINDRQMGKLVARSANIDISSDQQFPICGFEEPLGESSSFIGDSDFSPPSRQNHNSYASFANILSSPKAELWPTLKSPSAAGAGNLNDSLWVKPAPTVRRPQNDRVSESDSCYEFNDDILPPLPAQNLGDVLAEAIQQKQNKAGNCNNGNQNTNSNKKGKKGKKMLLFSTGMNFKGNQ